MTPKEKAQEFIDKFTFEIGNYNAKQCVLIAVDEIIQAIRYTDAKSDLGYVGYWNQVKQEIENL